ncbi:AbrB/MazE/SpoVT family DNA-binding domain-containing protein [Duganella guangzhouensis]|uniref:AbrB/MazE/SpoVT family DNA-binding domain-containing protein n=1 Tax=Duganella guangzhouensis TaxID=2666084 RepID=UPI0018A23D89|nr:AbrB/MazE/SpoVT family DNA-binding domain-containing protein [Duganella guangzhouensis]
MYEKAQLYFDGSRQLVHLPEGMMLKGNDIYVRYDTFSGDVILSRRPMSWEEFFKEDVREIVPADFMSPADRNQGEQTATFLTITE